MSKRGMTKGQADRLRLSRKRLKIIQRDAHTCYLCGSVVNESDIALDHVIPPSQGGGNTYANLRAACRACATLKGGLTLEKFFIKAPAYRKTINTDVLKHSLHNQKGHDEHVQNQR